MKHTHNNPANHFAMLLMALAMAFTFFACEEKGNKAEPSAGSTFTDARDGKAYKTIIIGSQTWMAENLNYKTDNSWCYDNDESNCKKYGRLYDWATAKGTCPSGWHLPSRKEWNNLIEVAGGKDYAGKRLKSKSSWNDNEGNSGNGTDELGFSALPGGNTGIDDGSFENVGETSTWWSATATECNRCGDAYTWYMHYSFDSAGEYDGADDRVGFSVRCVKD